MHLEALKSPFLGTKTPVVGYGFIDKSGQKQDTERHFLAFHPAKILPMAHFRKRSGSWQAIVEMRGTHESRTFPLKGEAQAWAARREAEIRGGELGIPDLTLDAVFERYARDVSSKKKGAKWEKARIGLVRRDPLALVRLRDFGKVQVAEWRERRLESVKPASVRREWNLLNNACNLAVDEWGWLKVNPFKQVKRPADGKARTRIATDAEIAVLLGRASPAMQRVIRFALETGMRAGEIAGLRAEDIAGNVATLRDTKNGTSRQVPLSKLALEQINGGERRERQASEVADACLACVSVRTNHSRSSDLIEQDGSCERSQVVKGNPPSTHSPEKVRHREKYRLTGRIAGAISPPFPPALFNLTAGSISGLFAKLCREVGIVGLTFHDIRASAATRLSKRLNPLQLAKMFGWKDVSMALVYYRETAEDVAKLLNAPPPTP